MKTLTILAAGAAALILVAILAGTGPSHDLEERSIDARFGLRSEDRTPGLAVVAIDDATFSALRRQWPLPRSMHARVIDRLRKAGARQIVYDVQFTEESDSRRDDVALYDAVRRAPGTVLATGESNALGQTMVLGGEDNLARIGAVAAAAQLPVEDGKIRRYAERAGKLDTIPTAVARQLGGTPAPSRFRDGRALIDYAGPAGTVPSYSFSDVYDGTVPGSALKDRIVIVGPTSPTLQDLQETSVGGARLMSHPEIEANAIRTALQGNPVQEAPGFAKYVLLFLLGGAGVGLVAALGPLRGAAGAALLGAMYAVTAQIAFGHDLVVPVAVPLTGLLLGTGAALLATAAAEIAERRHVTGRNAELEQAIRDRTNELELTHLEAVERMARAAELRDAVTGEHLDRMSQLCERVALALGEPAADAALLRQAAILHDVGKIGMPDRILQKTGTLTPEEIETMRRHTVAGAALLQGSRSPLLRLAEVIARTHHERWDGTGYPDGLQADEIPLPGRIAAVCDVYDALITERPYKRAWSEQEAGAEIAAQRGRHFDPAVADALLSVVGWVPASAELHAFPERA